MSGRLPVIRPSLSGTVVPTGPELLALVRRAGDLMLEQTNHEAYLSHRETYLELLVYAERDAYCAPILITSVQYVLDEESRRFKAGQFGTPRVDSGR